MKKIIFFLISIFLLSNVIAQTSAVEWHGKLRVSGSYILDERNDTVCLTGPSLFWSNTGWGGEDYYNFFVVEKLVEDWETPIIRAAMGVDENGGYLSDASNKDRVKGIIDDAITYGIYVIVDWHSHHAEDYETEAIAFFKEIAEEYGHYPNIIYEIYNEPLQISWNEVIKPYAESVIREIRKIDPDNIICVGTPSWSQGVHDAAASPIIGHSNIAYSMHFYAGTHTQWLRDRTKQAMNDGICIIATEWGMVNANGDGDVATDEVNLWVEFLEENHITNCIWALNDKNEGASMLKPGSSETAFWDQTDYTDCGKIAYELIKNSDGNWVGIEELSQDESQFYITNRGDVIYKGGNASDVTYTVFDVNGKLIAKNKESLNVDNLKSGVYILTVDNKNERISFKFVK